MRHDRLNAYMEEPEPKAQVESASVEPAYRNGARVMCRDHEWLDEMPCPYCEPKEVESGGLPLTLVEDRNGDKRHYQSDEVDEYIAALKGASLLREERQQELLRECYRILTTDSTGKEHDEVIQKLFKAAVTGE